MRVILFICAALLFIAVADLPIGCYTLLRIAITVGAVMVIVNEYKGDLGFWIIAFALVVILFNPIVPVYLHNKSAWMPIDIICGSLFVVRAVTWRNKT